jgi:hypothetical protein
MQNKACSADLIAKNAWLTGKPLAGKNDCRLNRPDESPHDETELCSA